MESGIPSFIGGLRAPCASSEDLTFRDDDGENDDTDQENDLDGNDAALDGEVKKLNDDVTPTPSISLCSTPSPNCASLAATPVHKPKQEINLCSCHSSCNKTPPPLRQRRQKRPEEARHYRPAIRQW